MKTVKDLLTQELNLKEIDIISVIDKAHTNLIFDIVIPFEIKKEEKHIKEKIEKEIKKINRNYYAVINIDNSYV